MTVFALQFLSLKSNSRMWLYGMSVEIALKQQQQILGTSENDSNGLVNIGEMIRKLELDGYNISENAKRFSKLLQTSSGLRMPTNSLTAFMEIIGKNSHVTKRHDNVAKESSSSTSSRTNEGESKTDQAASISKQDILIATIIQPMLTELENRLWTRLKSYLDEQQANYTKKLDQILELLEQRPSS